MNATVKEDTQQERRQGLEEITKNLNVLNKWNADREDRHAQLRETVDGFGKRMDHFDRKLTEHAVQSSGQFKDVNNKLEPIHNVATKILNFLEVSSCLVKYAKPILIVIAALVSTVVGIVGYYFGIISF